MGMSFVIDETSLPATLTARSMTDQEFAKLCGEHPDSRANNAGPLCATVFDSLPKSC